MVDLAFVGRSHQNSQWSPVAIHENHDCGAVPYVAAPHVISPFFDR